MAADSYTLDDTSHLETFMDITPGKSMSFKDDGVDAVMDVFLQDNAQIRDKIEDMDEAAAKAHLHAMYKQYLAVFEEKLRAGLELRRASERLADQDDTVPGNNEIRDDREEFEAVTSLIGYLLTEADLQQPHPAPLTDTFTSHRVTDAERTWLQRAASDLECGHRQLARIVGRSHNSVKKVVEE